MEQWIRELIGEQPGLKATFGVLMSFVTFMLGPWHVLLYVLGALFILDWITGLIAAGMEGGISSKEGLRRIPKKIGMVVVISLGHFADVALGTDTFFRDACLYFYCANEIFSITENAGRMGVPIPDPIRQAMKLLKDREEEAKEGKGRV